MAEVAPDIAEPTASPSGSTGTTPLCCPAGMVAELVQESETALKTDDFADQLQHNDDGSESLILVVQNLHCPSCIRSIESAVENKPGLLKARVNLSTRRLKLNWDPAETNAEPLLAAVAARGYRLVPLDPAQLESAEAEEGRALLRAMAVAGFAASNVMLLSVAVWSGLAADMGPATRTLMHWVSALIALPAVAYAGRPFFRSALAAVRGGHTNMDVPISLAVLLAAGMSLSETLRGGEQVFFDASVMLLFFLLIGRFLDLRLRGRARSAAENLTALKATAATVVAPDGSLHSLPIARLEPGMTVAVAAGERIPVDGKVLLGRSEVDTALLTGESLPRPVGEGSEVFAGTVNGGGPLRITVTKLAEASLLAEIVRLMENAEQGRDRYVRLADRVARHYAPAVHLLAAATFTGWMVLSDLPWQSSLMIAIAVLIITCPCALGLAVPAVQVAAVGRLLKQGILVKSADALERLAAVDTFVFDKTGTLTLGRPSLQNGSDIEPQVLALAAAMARHSRHPLARALCQTAPRTADRDLVVQEHAGDGLSTELDGRTLRLGRRGWCGIADDAAEGAQDGAMELWLAGGDFAPQRFVFRDAPRPDTADVIKRLQRRGIAVELLSGDRSPVAAQLAKDLGIDVWHGDCRPADKIARLEALAAEGRKTAMIGDGLNDAPALAAAFASLSPADAADISQIAADIVFQGDHLAPLVEALDTARSAKRLVLQNFALAMLYNLIAVPIAVAGFVTPLIAAVAMSSSSIIVTANAMRLNLKSQGKDA
ncbi:cadmium-translocating P-type ATPase [Pelagibius litoralis]|uniref:Cadmium-translocating P-type ATPase n=1 Tax=Pelagibius litoralis TaxID=374515 RepID=A0A967C5K7_9PROT|nr:heavy metal translocating P-type ATPase [Pelagibius litoralis]NIA69174.1 cadmium-translocating P-type ATPase [Pelagibius litoralis]